MDRIIKLITGAPWQWAAPMFSLVLSVRAAWAGAAWSGPAPAPLQPVITSATGKLAAVTETYIVDLGGSSTPSIELVAVGHSSDGRVQVVRARLPAHVRREAAPHRTSRVPGEGALWESCWRIVRHDRRGNDAIGCLRKRVRGNNHLDLTHPPEGVLRHPWRFDLGTQTFRVDDDPGSIVPVPHDLPADRSWGGRRFYFPLPLARITPAVAKRALRARGADISPTSESAQVLVLPDHADLCAFERASRPAAILPALRRGVPVLWERHLEAALTYPAVP